MRKFLLLAMVVTSFQIRGMDSQQKRSDLNNDPIAAFYYGNPADLTPPLNRNKHYHILRAESNNNLNRSKNLYTPSFWLRNILSKGKNEKNVIDNTIP